MKKLVRYTFNTALPIIFAVAILWWMYRGFSWQELTSAFSHEMDWTWMWLSFPFGILAQVFRALRWRDMLHSLGERVSVRACVNAVYISYASSLVVPRAGEVLRCGMLHKSDGTSFSRSLGTVMSERVVDMLLVLLISSLTMMMQIPVFMRFYNQTGISFQGLFHYFTTPGYVVTAVCAVVALATGILILRRINLFSRTRMMLSELYAGLLSVFHLQRPGRFLFYSLGIWASYYLHFYLTFRCFGFTEHLSPMVALVAFVVGCFAVLVPTPNGAGPWHFSVKTVLVLYGVPAEGGAIFALVVHMVQTLLVAVLGVYATALFWMKKKTDNKSTIHIKQS